MDTRTVFHQKLREIQDDVLAMGSMVAKALSRSMEALKNRDTALAQQIIDDDKKINARRFEIEEKCILLIATQAPMASDLRIIIGVLNIITELERMGDHAEGNARIAIMIGDEPPLNPYVDLPRMTERCVDMLNRSLAAMINRDAETAKKIIAEDDFVDNLYDQVFRELFNLHDRGPAHHPPGHPPHLGGPQPGALRRPHHQYLREGYLHGNRQDGRAGRLQILGSRYLYRQTITPC
jgi:phosphate transport system protein